MHDPSPLLHRDPDLALAIVILVYGVLVGMILKLLARMIWKGVRAQKKSQNET